MSGTTTIHVNFGRPIPLFPLSEAVLMPHSIAPLNIFEPRYLQMVSDALDGAGLIAMAVYAGPNPTGPLAPGVPGRPRLRPAVCVGHIAEHFKFPDGRYAIILQGICRGRIVEELRPEANPKLYREAMIEPVGVENVDETALATYRDQLSGSLSAAPLCDLKIAGEAVKHLRNPQVPTAAVIEFLGANLPEGRTETESRYGWLAAGAVAERAAIVSRRLDELQKLLKKAAPQRAVETPKGCNWN